MNNEQQINKLNKITKKERTKKSEDLWSEDDLVHQAFSNRVCGWYIHIGKEDLMLFLCMTISVASHSCCGMYLPGGFLIFRTITLVLIGLIWS
jgi:hypothetical protein